MRHLRVLTQANQCNGTNEYIFWFHGIKNKDKYVIIQYNIKHSYNSISGKKNPAWSIGLRQELY